VNVQDVEGNTPLHLAARATGPGPNEVIRLLMRCRCRLDVANAVGQMALDNVVNHQVCD
jgi:ankyrin repeat protein